MERPNVQDLIRDIEESINPHVPRAAKMGDSPDAKRLTPRKQRLGFVEEGDHLEVKPPIYPGLKRTEQDPSRTKKATDVVPTRVSIGNKTNTGLLAGDNISDLTFFNTRQEKEFEQFLRDTLQLRPGNIKQECVRGEPVPIVKKERVRGEPVVKEEYVRGKPGVKQEHVIDEPAQEKERVRGEPVVKEEYVREEPGVKQDHVIEEPVHEKEHVIDEPVHEKERVRGEPVVKEERVRGESVGKHGRLKCKKGWEKPLMLISTNLETGQFEIITEAKEQMTKLEERLVVIGIVGPYRAGKSALMNMIAMDDSKIGFGVENTTASTTKGIWVWCFEHPSQENTCLVLMDSEGSGDVKKHDAKHDERLFVLNTLLCSAMIYNSVGAITADAIQKLEIVAELAEKIKIRPSEPNTENEEERLFRICPMFVWVLRDWHLEFENGTPDDYLDDALKCKPGFGRKVREYNVVRECIMLNFPMRKCFTLPNPISGVYGVHMKDHTVDQHQKFKEEARNIQNYLISKAGHKMIFQSEIKGKDFIELAVIYTQQLSEDSVPCVVAAYRKLAEKNNEKKLEEAKAVFDECFEKQKEFSMSAEAALQHFIEGKRYNIKYVLKLMGHMMKNENVPQEMLSKVEVFGGPIGPRGHAPEADLWEKFTTTLTKHQIEHTKVVTKILDDQREYMQVMMGQYIQQSKHLMRDYKLAERHGNEQQAEEILMNMNGLKKEYIVEKKDYKTVVDNLTF